MIEELKPYPAMKESGVLSLGSIPEHWLALPLGRLGRFHRGHGGSKEDDVGYGVPRVRYGELYTRFEHTIVRTFGAISSEIAERYALARRGDVLFALSGEAVDDIGASAEIILPTVRCGGDLAILRPGRPTHPGFLGIACRSLPIASQKAISATGTTVKHIGTRALAGVTVPIPPIDEQAAIVRFLDHADRRIRRYIRAKQKLIKLLEEQKQAIIHRAVTRGLDPSVPVRPTGSRWFPQVPAHWQVVAMGRVVPRAVDGPHHSPKYVDDGIPFVSARNVKVDRWNLDDAKYISASDYKEFSRRVVPEMGDVLYTKGGTTGVARAVDLSFPFQVWVHIAVLKLRKDMVDPFFLANVLNSPRCYEQSQLFTRGATNQDLGLGRMRQIEITLPPLQEQRQITEALRGATTDIVNAVEAARREIDLLSELRTRLIADVVTGQLDVRAAAAALPDEPDDDEALDDAERGDDDFDGDDAPEDDAA